MKRIAVFLLVAVLAVLPGAQVSAESVGLGRFIPEGYTPEQEQNGSGGEEENTGGPVFVSEGPGGSADVSDGPSGPGAAMDVSASSKGAADVAALIPDQPDFGPGGIIKDDADNGAGAAVADGPGSASPSGPSGGPGSPSSGKKKKKGAAGPRLGYRIPAGLETVPAEVGRLSLPAELPGAVAVLSVSAEEGIVRLELDQPVPKLKIREISGDTAAESTIFSRKNAKTAEAHATARNSAAFRIQMIWPAGPADYIREYIYRSGQLQFLRGTITEELNAAEFEPYTSAVRTRYFDENGILVSEVYAFEDTKEAYARITGYDTAGALTYARQRWHSLTENGYILDVVQDGIGEMTDMMYKGERSDIYLRSQNAGEDLLAPRGVRMTARDIALFDQEVYNRYPSLAVVLTSALETASYGAGLATPTDLGAAAGYGRGTATPTDLDSPAGMPSTDIPASRTDLSAAAETEDAREAAEQPSLPEGTKIWSFSSGRYPEAQVFVFVTDKPMLQMKENRVRLNHEARDIEGRLLADDQILRTGSPPFDLLIIE